MYCLVRKECVELTDKTGLKAAVIIKEISTTEKKPDIFALQKQRRCPKGKTPSIEGSLSGKNANKFERRQLQLSRWLVLFPVSGKPMAGEL